MNPDMSILVSCHDMLCSLLNMTVEYDYYFVLLL